jgi:S1-C subfamily serine protease
LLPRASDPIQRGWPAGNWREEKFSIRFLVDQELSVRAQPRSNVMRTPIGYAAGLAAMLLFSSFSGIGQSGPKNLPSGPPSKSLADIVEAVSNSVVRVTAIFTAQVAGQNSPPQTKSCTSGGTGFVIDQGGHIVTAGHVVDPRFGQACIEKSLAQGQVLLPGSVQLVAIQVSAPPFNLEDDGRGNQFYNINIVHHAQLLHEDGLLDVALLLADPNLLLVPGVLVGGKALVPPRSVPEFQGEAPRPGDPISVSGFPAVTGFEAGIPGLTTNTGIISNAFFKDELGRTVYLADLHANHGDSGGPVFNNSTGRIIGFVDRYYPTTNGENSGLTVIIPIRQILKSFGNIGQFAAR